MDYENIRLYKSEEDRDSMSVVPHGSLGSETAPIPHELIEHIEALYDSGIKYISCGGDIVEFTMWSIMDESRGIIYSYTGTTPDGEQLIEVSQLRG